MQCLKNPDFILTQESAQLQFLTKTESIISTFQFICQKFPFKNTHPMTFQILQMMVIFLFALSTFTYEVHANYRGILKGRVSESKSKFKCFA